MVIFAAELLKGAEELVRQKIHPNSVIAGYTLACKEAVKYIRENLTIPIAEINRESIVNAAKVRFLEIHDYFGKYLWFSHSTWNLYSDFNELKNYQYALRIFR